MKEETMEKQFKLMKLQTALMAGILVLLLAVGCFVVYQVNNIMNMVNAVDLDKVNATVASLQSTAAELEKLDMEQISAAVESLKGAAETLSKTDIGAINEGIQSLTDAAGNLSGLDIQQINELISSLETVAAQMEKTTSAFSKLFGK